MFVAFGGITHPRVGVVALALDRIAPGSAGRLDSS
jgi:hypothetical protein